MDYDRYPLAGSSAAVFESHPGADEETIADDRSTCSPSEMVQQKLRGLLPTACLPASCIHTGRLVRRFSS